MDTIISDVRYALRSLAKSRLFTAVAVASLALGIGANVTVFSIVNSLLLRPLPYTQPERLVDVSEWSATQLCSGCGVGTSLDGFLDWEARAHSFSGIGAYLERPFNVSGTETAERIGGAVVSAETFGLLGVAPALGRGFSADDDRVGAAPVVLLSDGLWNRRYGGDRRIIGQTIRVNGNAATVIGVMPPKFGFPEFAQLWMPLLPYGSGHGDRSDRGYSVVARLAPGVTPQQANAEMRLIAANIEREHPATQKEWTAKVAPFSTEFEAMPPSMSLALLGAVGFVLLIVCANLAGLLLARGAKRQREVAIRLALGATRRQIVRHLLTESLLLSIAGGALGLLIASWAIDGAVKAIGSQAPFYVVFGLDTMTMAYCLGVSILTGALFGLFPALRVSTPDVQSTLKDSAVTAKKSAARGLLVVGELALAMVLLAGAGLLMKSVARISAPETGYDELGLLTGSLEFFDSKYFRDSLALPAAQRQITERLAQLPGVSSAALDRMDFVAGFGQSDRRIQAAGVATLADGVSPRFYHAVTPEYFATVKLPVVAGRAFTAQDRAGSERVVMINQRMASQIWPGQSAIGKKIKLGGDSLPWLSVVGIVGDIGGGDRQGSRARNYAYVPAAQAPADYATILLRATGDPLALIPAVRATVQTVDPDLPVIKPQTVAQQHRDDYWPYQVYAISMGIFALFAILLSALGLYGVIAYNTAQRTREIGVRMALGAQASDVLRMIIAQGGRLVALGIVAGTIGSALMLRALSGMLFGLSSIDPAIYAAVGALLAIVSLAASWIPARRAAKIDPLAALRAE